MSVGYEKLSIQNGCPTLGCMQVAVSYIVIPRVDPQDNGKDEGLSPDNLVSSVEIGGLFYVWPSRWPVWEPGLSFFSFIFIYFLRQVFYHVALAGLKLFM